MSKPNMTTAQSPEIERKLQASNALANDITRITETYSFHPAAMWALKKALEEWGNSNRKGGRNEKATSYVQGRNR